MYSRVNPARRLNHAIFVTMAMLPLLLLSYAAAKRPPAPTQTFSSTVSAWVNTSRGRSSSSNQLGLRYELAMDAAQHLVPVRLLESPTPPGGVAIGTRLVLCLDGGTSMMVVAPDDSSCTTAPMTLKPRRWCGGTAAAAPVTVALGHKRALAACLNTGGCPNNLGY
jgi:hypothetical protein